MKRLMIIFNGGNYISKAQSLYWNVQLKQPI